MSPQERQMPESELQSLAEQLSLRYFHKPFVHEAVYNPRLRTTGGRYMLGDHSIQVNPEVERVHGREEMIGVLKHELCHYHLHIEGRGYKHGDRDFRELLQRTGSPRYCKPMAARQARRVREYTCSVCRMKYERKKRVDTARYRCGKCHGKLEETT